MNKFKVGDYVKQKCAKIRPGQTDIIYRRGIVKSDSLAPMYCVHWYEEEGKQVYGVGHYNESLLLPDIPKETDITEYLELQHEINMALDNRDKTRFLELTDKLIKDYPQVINK